jgi:hypothetical protein
MVVAQREQILSSILEKGQLHRVRKARLCSKAQRLEH